MTSKRKFSIAELVERSGVPATSVHHYASLGLLPPAERVAANRFLYDDRHVHALRLVRVLRERRQLPLETIAEILPTLLADESDAFRPAMWDRVVASVEEGRGARRALLDAARKEFVARGYADVNVAELCEAAGIAKGSFYRYFTSKEALFLAAVDAAARDVVARFLARAPAGVPAPVAQDLLGELLAADLPLLLELAIRGLQHHADHASAARVLFTAFVEAVGVRVEGTTGDPAVASRVVQAAIAHALHLTLWLERH